MTKGGNTVMIVPLKDYLKSHAVRLHHLYLQFPFAELCLGDAEMKYVSNCCTRRPVVLLKDRDKRILIDNRYCYAHACEIAGPDNSDMAIKIHEVKTMQQADIHLRIFMDSLQACPLMSTKPIFKAAILYDAFHNNELRATLKYFFDMRSLSAFGRMFGIEPPIFTRFKHLDLPERHRLALGNYLPRGNSTGIIKKSQ